MIARKWSELRKYWQPFDIHVGTPLFQWDQPTESNHHAQWKLELEQVEADFTSTLPRSPKEQLSQGLLGQEL